MYQTSGDMIYNPATNQWQPIAGNPLPPYAPQGGDPVGGAGMVLTPSLSQDARELHLAELRKQGLPVPPALGGQQESHTTDAAEGEAPQLVETTGEDRHVVGLEELGPEVEEEEAPKRDTDRPPPRKGRGR